MKKGLWEAVHSPYRGRPTQQLRPLSRCPLGPRSLERPLLAVGGWPPASRGASAFAAAPASFRSSARGSSSTVIGLSDFLGLPRLLRTAGCAPPVSGPSTFALAGSFFEALAASISSFVLRSCFGPLELTSLSHVCRPQTRTRPAPPRPLCGWAGSWSWAEIASPRTSPGWCTAPSWCARTHPPRGRPPLSDPTYRWGHRSQPPPGRGCHRRPRSSRSSFIYGSASSR